MDGRGSWLRARSEDERGSVVRAGSEGERGSEPGWALAGWRSEGGGEVAEGGVAEEGVGWGSVSMEGGRSGSESDPELESESGPLRRRFPMMGWEGKGKPDENKAS